MNDLPLAQSHVKSGEGLLAHILDGFPRLQPRAQFHLDQRGEIHAKMLLRAKVSCPQPLDVGFVKGVKLQELAPGIGKWQTVYHLGWGTATVFRDDGERRRQ